MKIYYLIPDVSKRNFSVREIFRSFKRNQLREYFEKRVLGKKKPIGGVKVIFQHCMLLNELGFHAVPVRMGGYEGNFFGYDIKTIGFKKLIEVIKPEDIVVIPELVQSVNKLFKKNRKVIFFQNGRFLYDSHPIKGERVTKSYIESGFDYVLTCSDFLYEILTKEPIEKKILVKNYIDHNVFFERKLIRETNRILAMPRKNPRDLNEIREGLKGLPINIVYADGLTEDQLVCEYQKSDIFISTGYPEGFGLPPLEAMSCGAVVVGFTGGGANEYMIHRETALVANDGDISSVIKYIKELLNDSALKNQLRSSGLSISRRYSKCESKKQLENFYHILDKNKY